MPIARINDHDMYYEVLGQGEPILCMGGWGTFCHDNHHHLARGLTDRYQVIVFDYRGIGESTDDLTRPSTMALHADIRSTGLDTATLGTYKEQIRNTWGLECSMGCADASYHCGFPDSRVIGFYVYAQSNPPLF